MAAGATAPPQGRLFAARLVERKEKVRYFLLFVSKKIRFILLFYRVQYGERKTGRMAMPVNNATVEALEDLVKVFEKWGIGAG